MSGAFGSSQWMYSSGAAGFYPYSIDQSLRFNAVSESELSRTFAAGNRRKWTFSTWMKRSELTPSGSDDYIFGTNTGAANSTFMFLSWRAGDNLIVTGQSTLWLRSDRVFRDVSGWYHIVWSLDTDNATASQRMRLYVNGTELTSFSTDSRSSLTGDQAINAAVEHNIGRHPTATGYGLGAYLAETHFIDGQALDPTSFGETVNNIWVPKNVSGLTYGTNGFYLSFADSAAIGDDLSGNTNDWTANNLAASDVVTDSPTNNFATFNPLDISGTTLTYSEGNLKAERTSTSNAQAYSSFSFNSGKWYAEFLLDTGNSGVGVIAGTTNAGANRYLGQDSFTYSYYFDGRKVNNATYTAYGDSYTTAADGSGDVVGVYIDADNGDIYFSKNGTVQNSGTAAFTGVTGPFRFAIASESNCFHIANFGQDDSFAGLKTSGSAAASDDNGNGVFYDAIGLSGYLAPCSANLPEPTIGPNSTTTSDEHFNTVLYTGNGSTQSITGAGHQPNLVWIKSRAATRHHMWYDSVRGATKAIRSSLTNAEITGATTLTSFDSDGFSLGSDSDVNTNAEAFVSWNWKAGGTAVSNTDGSITSSVSANPDAGMSIVSWTGTGANATVGHGLSSAPDLVIVKNRSIVSSWLVRHSSDSISNTPLLENSTGGISTNYWQSTQPDSSVFYVSSNSEANGSGNNLIAYCFANTEGHLKCGKYVGNNSTDGPFNYTGFRPAFVIIKRTDSTAGWVLYDNKRDTYNQMQYVLWPNLYNAEYTSNLLHVDFLSNGFKIRNATYGETNASGGTYIYIAFAKAPFKYANAR